MNWYVNQAAEFGSLLTVIKNVRHLREFELLSKLERQVCLKNLLQWWCKNQSQDSKQK